MAGDPLYYLGKTIKPHGNAGHLLVQLDAESLGDPKEIRSLYLDLDGELVPFLIEFLELRANGRAVIRFEDLNSVEEAKPLTGKEIFVSSSFLPNPSENGFHSQEVTGYSVVDKQQGMIGVVDKVIKMQYQSLLQIRNENNEILIPIVDAIVKRVDRKKRTIFIEAPEGLIGIYR